MTSLSDRVWASVSGCRPETWQISSVAFSPVAPEPTTMSLCFAVLIAELYGLMHRIPTQVWAETLISCQDAETGLFIDPRFSGADLTPESPGERYLHLQTTYFALNALDAMGFRPAHALRFASPFRVAGHIQKWLEGLDWSNPWRESNMVMFIAAGLQYRWERDGEAAAGETLHHMLDWLDANQEPETGLWGTRSGASLMHAMAGGYHFLPFYFVCGRRVPHAEHIIDSTLSLQHADGLFHSDGGGDTCLDVDAIDMLVKLSLVTAHRGSEVEAALERAHHGLLRNQDEDGGFCRARERPYPAKSRKRRLAEAVGLDRLLGRPYAPPSQVQYYSGWSKMPFDVRRSDLWSTWFRSFGLALISSRLPGRFPSQGSWTFRRLPALGWHDAQCILSAA